MQHVQILAPVALKDAAKVYARLARFEEYPSLTDAVRAVTVRCGPDGRRESDWQVTFRDGLLCWSEEDEFDEESRVLRFIQKHGDFEHFSGEWAVLEAATGCTVRFKASFDLGMASLADLVDPLAVRILRENVESIVTGLFRSDH
jgi:ribosome-associated toxin RatA of RatAB toxin-antitoxin module